MRAAPGTKSTSSRRTGARSARSRWWRTSCRSSWKVKDRDDLVLLISHSIRSFSYHTAFLVNNRAKQIALLYEMKIIAHSRQQQKSRSAPAKRRWVKKSVCDSPTFAAATARLPVRWLWMDGMNDFASFRLANPLRAGNLFPLPLEIALSLILYTFLLSLNVIQAPSLQVH